MTIKDNDGIAASRHRGIAASRHRGIVEKEFAVFFFAITLPVFLIIGIAFLASEYYGAPVGGISRRGAWPERDYLWRAKQAALPLVANNTDLKNPDVVVIGDSFSLQNAWQSVVTRDTGLEIKTYNYANNHNCYLPWINQIGEGLEGNGKLIIIESIEHQFIERFKNPEKCKDSSVFLVRPITGGHDWVWPDKSSWKEIDLLRQFRTIAHQFQLWRAPDEVHGEWIRNAPLTNNSLFSNYRSDRLLYLDLDDQRLKWTLEDIQQAGKNLKITQDYLASKGFRFALLIVPDKVHVYEDALLHPWKAHPASNLTRSLNELGVSTFEVIDHLKQSTLTNVDLYMPNDDHLGPAGQIQLAKAMMKNTILKKDK